MTGSLLLHRPEIGGRVAISLLDQLGGRILDLEARLGDVRKLVGDL